MIENESISHSIFDRCNSDLTRRKTPLKAMGVNSLHYHLQLMYDILESWGEPPYVCFSGMLHRAYLTDDDGEALYTLAERSYLKSLVGDDAERLIYLAASVSLEGIRRFYNGSSLIRSKLDIVSILDGQSIRVTRNEMRNLIAIAVANLATQSLQADAFPDRWLSEASELATLIVADPLPVFGRCTLALSFDLEETLLRCYRKTWESPLDEIRRVQLKETMSTTPVVGEPFILLGLISAANGHLQEAAEYANAARSLICEWGVAWDKRISGKDWLLMAHLLSELIAIPAESSDFISGFIRRVLNEGSTPESFLKKLDVLKILPMDPMDEPISRSDAALSGCVFNTDDVSLLPARFSEYLESLLTVGSHRTHIEYPGLRKMPLWIADEFEIVKALEGAASDIAEEFLKIESTSFHPESEPIERAGDWSVFILFERGRRRDDRCEVVPKTMEIIEDHATVRTQAGLIYFSRLAPGTIVAPHRGPTNVRLRCHLGISIPENCGLSVGDVQTSWLPGKCIVFDDSFTHSVWNSSDEDRVVLIVDIWHPDLDDREVELLSGLHGYAMSLALGMGKYWQKNDEAIVAVN